MIVKTEGIVLRSFDLRETSRIVSFFTRDHGKVSGVLKGIRADHKKFGSSVDKFSVNDIVYYQYRNSDIHLVSQCDLKQFFFPIRQDLKKSMAANYILELISVVMPAEERNRKVYNLMMSFLTSLETAQDINKLVHIFQIKMLLHSGFKPHLDTCVQCKKTIDGKARFSLKDGGLVCSHCHVSDATVHLVSKGTVASILYAERSDWKNGMKLKLTESVKKELKYVLNNFLVFHLGRQLRSAKYLS